MNSVLKTGLDLFAIAFALFAPTIPVTAQIVRSWTTTVSLENKLSARTPTNFSHTLPKTTASILIDEKRTYQTVFGIGSSLEHSTCFNLSLMTDKDRTDVLRHLLRSKIDGGMNLMRICIGTSDFTGDPWYSYDDLPAGMVDPSLAQFSIAKDRKYILPILKQASSIKPNHQFFASPWSPPGWMKSTGNMIGGRLLPKWYSAYALYFVKFIRAYEREGIPIYAVTVQNEPGVDRSKQPKMSYPSCHWTAEEERDFIKGYLGPALRNAGLKTRIWCYDHNFNVKPDNENAGISYPRTILNDSEAAKYVDAVAFHGYVGEPSGMTAFHKEFPKATIRFTEGSVFDIGGAEHLVDLFRNWASSYNAWVTMLDTHGKPNFGPFEASKTMVMRDAKTNHARYLFEFYMLGQFTTFVQRGAVRIGSEGGGSLKHVAFRNPDGKIVVVVVNSGDKAVSTQIRCRGKGVDTYAQPKSLTTFVWKSRPL